MWKAYHSFLSGSQGGKAAVFGTGGVSGRWMYVVREDHRRRQKCLLNSLRASEAPGACLCMCADGRRPNPKCHIQFPAKHLAPAQRNWLVSADVIMVYGLIPVSRSWVPLAHILPCCISTLCGIFWPPWTQMSRICSQWVRALLSAILQKRTHLSKQSSIIIRPTAVMKRSDWK